MKRTKETYFKEQPAWVERETVSGCREFDGEDLSTKSIYILEHDARR
jgi:hypothetical protein